MALAAAGVGALLVSCTVAVALQAATEELASRASTVEAGLRASTEEAGLRAASEEAGLRVRATVSSTAHSYLSVVETIGSLMEDTPVDHPEWCRNETNLTWKQRRERMQQQVTLTWAKQEMRRLLTENQAVPPWMDKMVTEEKNRGRLKWAVQEEKRLKAEGKDVPAWMAELAAEDKKWANRWAACKASELRATGEEVPPWMVENGRRGIIDYATEKAAEIQSQIDQLEDIKEKEVALVQAHGDVKVARQRVLASVRTAKVRSVDQQVHALEGALADLAEVEETAHRPDYMPMPQAKLKQTVSHARESYDLLGRILQAKFAVLRSRV